MGERGSVLLHVLVTGAVVALIASSLLQVTMLRYQVTARAESQTRETRSNDAALARLLGAWNAANASCSDGNGYTCSGTAGTCSCICNAGALDPRVTVTGPAGGPCTLSIESKILQ